MEETLHRYERAEIDAGRFLDTHDIRLTKGLTTASISGTVHARKPMLSLHSVIQIILGLSVHSLCLSTVID